jgi:ubiquitin C-terminal hydrolase
MDNIETAIDRKSSDTKENMLSSNVNSKKRLRETNEDENLFVRHRKGKIERDGITRMVENVNNMPPVLNQISEKGKNINSDLYDFTTKNDVLNILWKINASREDFLGNNSNSLILSEKYFSKRRDNWFFQLEHLNGGKNAGLMRFSIKCCDDNSFVTEDSYLASIFKNINFEVEVSFQLINYKSQNFIIKNLNYNSLEHKEIHIPTEFYSSNSNSFYSSTRSTKNIDKTEDEVIIILELSIHKNFPSLVNNKEINGFTGIVNEAATCYMNSMLQTLNIFGSFKRAVFQIPTAEDDYHSVALSLQRLFYDLMTDSHPVSTNRLVRSFGWGREQMHIQHDVQEFNILLSDIMEKKMKGTPGEGTFNKHFAGILNNYIQCVNVDYKSNKEEKFMDLQLTVKGCKDIYQSFNLYTEEEILDNADKYYAEGYGKQKAKKGIRFVKFPSVLIIQLKRFEYNPKKEAMVKINDCFEFYEELDLGRYLIKNTTNNYSNEDNNNYTLHSVVVHQGSANSGHYYAYIKPTLKDFWVQFNDEIVRPADKYEVFNNNFGGTHKTYRHKSKGEIISNSNSYESNAYILVYIKNSERKNILNPVLSLDIPVALRNRFEHEKNEDRKLQLKKIRTTENLNMILITKENVLQGENKTSRLGIITTYADLDKSAPLIMNKYSRLLINFPSNLTLLDFLNFIKTETNIPINLMKLYEYNSGDTSMDSLIKCRSDFELNSIDEEGLKRSLHELTNNYKKRIISLFLYVDDETETLKVLRAASSKSKEEFKIDDKFIHISKDLNKFSLSFNNNMNHNSSIIDKYNSTTISNEYSMEPDSKLIFIKEFNRSTGTFIITNIKKINLSSLDNFEDFSEKINKSLIMDYQSKIYYFIESTSISESTDTNVCLGQTNYISIFNKTSSVILIPVQEKEKEATLNKLQEMYDTIYVDIFCPERKAYIRNKISFNLKNCQDEISIKYRILKEIKDKNLFKYFVELNNHYYVDQYKVIKKVDETLLDQFISEEYIELFQERDSGPKFFQACKETPLLKYINQADCRIDLNITFFLKQVNPEYYSHNISLFDIDNNRICIITGIFPKKVKRCRDVIDYLYDTILTNSDYCNANYDQENFFFILQHPSENYIYQMLVDNNTELLKHEGKAEKLEYRLQPFKNEVKECFQDGNCLKIFVSFLVSCVNVVNPNDSAIFDPVVIFVKKGTKMFELKFMISEQLKRMKPYDQLCNKNYLLKFFSSKIENSKIKKDLNLQHFKEDDPIDHVLKDLRIYNILTNIVIQNEK